MMKTKKIISITMILILFNSVSMYSQIRGKLTLSPSDFGTVRIESGFDKIKSETDYTTNEVGNPELPVYRATYVLPMDVKVTDVIFFQKEKQLLKENIYILPLQASWTEYTINTNSNSIVDKLQYFLDGDTVIDGVSYHQVKKGRNPQSNYIGALREADGKIFTRTKYHDEQGMGEFLLYDFTLNVGDKVVSSVPEGELSISPTVVKIENIQLLNGEKRKKYYFDQAEEWIEGIGSIKGLFYPSLWHLTDYTVNKLVCFQQNDIQLFKSTEWCDDGTCCDILSGLQHSFKDISGLIFPNPVKEFIKIDLSKLNTESAKLKILDISGKLRENIEIKESRISLNISNYNSGIYFVNIEYNNTVVNQKIIKL